MKPLPRAGAGAPDKDAAPVEGSDEEAPGPDRAVAGARAERRRQRRLQRRLRVAGMAVLIGCVAGAALVMTIRRGSTSGPPPAQGVAHRASLVQAPPGQSAATVRGGR